MLNYSICVDSVFRTNDFIANLKTLKENGFDNFEFWFWWNKDMDAIIKAKNELGMNMTGFCTKMITMLEKEASNDYLEGLKETIELAQKANCKTIISQVGSTNSNTREYQIDMLKTNLLKASDLLKDSGIVLAIEPLNERDHSGYFLQKSDEAFSVLRDVNRKEAKLLYDIYHQQITEGDILYNIEHNLEHIGHIHASGEKGRSELNYSEINYKYVLNEIVKMGYKGYLGMEYRSTTDEKVGLDFLKTL